MSHGATMTTYVTFAGLVVALGATGFGGLFKTNFVNQFSFQ
jgi:hypothetical protein